MSGSPLPRYEVVSGTVLFPGDEKRAGRWYVYRGRVDDEPYFDRRGIDGGPYGTRKEAEEEIDRRYAEMNELYEWVEEGARRGGFRVQW